MGDNIREPWETIRFAVAALMDGCTVIRLPDGRYRVPETNSYGKDALSALYQAAGHRDLKPVALVPEGMVLVPADRLATLEALPPAVLAYDAAIQRYAEKGQSWVEGDDLDALYDDWLQRARAATAEEATEHAE